MTQEQIIAANRVSALEQVEQDERNDELKAQIEAEKLLTPAPRLPRYEHEQTFKESTLEQLSDIQRENVESSRQNQVSRIMNTLIPASSSINLNTQNIASCLQTTNNIGNTVYHNVCNGAAYSGPWGSADWLLAIVITVLVLGFLCMLGAMVWSINN